MADENDGLVDLWGDPWTPEPDPRGRKRHRRAPQVAEQVAVLRAAGLTVEEVATRLVLSEPTLRKYYFRELDGGAKMAQAVLTEAMWKKAKEGNVSAARFIRESFGSLQVPLLGVSGTLDKQQNGLSAENRKEAFSLWPAGGHRFVWLDGAKHLDFTDSAGADRKATPSPTRDDVQPVTRAATLLFFDAHLKGDEGAGKRLTQTGLRPYLKGKINQVEVLAK